MAYEVMREIVRESVTVRDTVRGVMRDVERDVVIERAMIDIEKSIDQDRLFSDFIKSNNFK